MLCSRSYPQLRATFDKYKAVAKKDISESIESEMSGDLKEGFLAIGKMLLLIYGFLNIIVLKALRLGLLILLRSMKVIPTFK